MHLLIQLSASRILTSNTFYENFCCILVKAKKWHFPTVAFLFMPFPVPEILLPFLLPPSAQVPSSHPGKVSIKCCLLSSAQSDLCWCDLCHFQLPLVFTTIIALIACSLILFFSEQFLTPLVDYKHENQSFFFFLLFLYCLEHCLE